MASHAVAVESISGTIVSDPGGTPLSAVDVDVFDSTGTFVPLVGESSNASGQYTALLPGPGTYTVRADPSVSNGVADEWYNNVFLRSAATTVTVGAGQAVSNINFSLPSGVLVAGSVTASGAPLGSIDLDVFSNTGEFLGGYPGTTLANGLYTVGALPPGSYFIRADPNPALGQFFQRTYFGGSPTLLGATPVVVGGTNVLNINIDLAPGGSIGGIVQDSVTGAPLVGFDLDLFDALGVRLSIGAKTDALGAYEIGVVPAGNYFLRVDPTILQGYARTYYLNTPALSGATPITVTAGAKTAGINFALGLGGTISGTIRAFGSGAPLDAIDLDLFDALGNRLGITAKSDVTGAYQIGPMAPGAYFLRADPTILQLYAQQVYNGQIDVNFGNPVFVAAGADTSPIDFNLVLAGTITGTVRDTLAQPLAGIDLDLYDAVTGVRLGQGEKTALDGTYSFVSLTPGMYKVRADPTLAQGFTLVYFNGKLTKVLADPITVTSSVTTANVDMTLGAGASVSGLVTDVTNGGPIPNMDLDIFQAITFVRLNQTAKTDVNGLYTIPALPPGNYVVRADPRPGQPFFLTYFGGALTAPLATVITVSAGQNLGAIDIGMAVDPSKLPLLTTAGLALAAAVLLLAGIAVLYGDRRGKAGP